MSKPFCAQLADLYRIEAGRMLAHASRRLPTADQAHDAVQETFVRLAEKGSFEDVKKPAAYAMGVLDKLIMNELRRKYADGTLSIETLVPGESPSTPDVADGYERVETRRLVAEALGAVRSARARHFLTLFSQGYKPEKIADEVSHGEINISGLEVRRALRNAKRSLSREFRGRGLLPSVLFPAWLLKIRLRLRNDFERFGNVALTWDPTGVIFQVVAVLSMTATGLSLTTTAAASSPNGPVGWRARPVQTSAGANRRSSLLFVSSTPAEPLPEKSSSPERATDKEIPASLTVAPEKEAKDMADAKGPMSPIDPRSFGPGGIPDHVAVDTPEGPAQVNRTDQSNSDAPAPSVPDQTAGLVVDPGQIPLPACWGLPGCDQLPTHLGKPTP